MAFEKRADARTHQPQDGDTLESIAKRETDAGNPITPDELALFNWGTEDPVEVNSRMRDELGARARNPDRTFTLSGDDKARADLLIPTRFRREGLQIEKTHVIRVRRHAAPKQFLGCCTLPAVTFGFDSSFLRPSVADHLRPLEQMASKLPAAKILVFGHTDAVGTEIYNKKLSERRAWSAYAFIVNDAAAWETLYNAENWGAGVLQEILADLGHDPGPIDGDMGPSTTSAMRSFLGLGNGESVSNNADFRGQLFLAYMSSKHDIELTSDRFLDPGYMGCGEFNLLESTNKAEESNRRVTFYFFNEERPPNLPCAFGNVTPCKNQMVTRDLRFRPGFGCSFYDDLARSCPTEGPVPLIDATEIVLVDEDQRPVRKRPCRVTVGGEVFEGATDEDGVFRVEHPGKSGPCKVEFPGLDRRVWGLAGEPVEEG